MAKIPLQVVAAATVAVLVVAFVAIESSGEHSGSLPLSVSATASVSASISSSSSQNSSAPGGLRLTIVLNSTSIQWHGNLTAEIELTNTLDQNLTVALPSPSQSVLEWNGDDFLCSLNPSDSLVDYAVFQGHFTEANVSEAGSPLQQEPPAVVPCPTESSYPGSAVFSASSDQATVYRDGSASPVTSALVPHTGYCSTSQGVTECGEGSGLVGYWNRNGTYSGTDLNFTSPAFTYFPPGEYTLVATDLWNQYAYATFEVLPNS